MDTPQIWQWFKFIDTQVPYVLCRVSSLIIWWIFVSAWAHLWLAPVYKPFLTTVGRHRKQHFRVRFSSSSTDSKTLRLNLPGCKVSRNPLKLYRGANYRRLTVPLSNFDMNLSPQGHQTIFPCDRHFMFSRHMEKAQRGFKKKPSRSNKKVYQDLELSYYCI